MKRSTRILVSTLVALAPALARAENLDTSKPLVCFTRPQSSLSQLRRLNISAETSNRWPRVVGTFQVSRAFRKLAHGLRQLFRSMIRPRCSRRHDSASMYSSNSASSPALVIVMSVASSGT